MTAVLHPKQDDQGRAVTIKHPSRASPLAAWTDPDKVATVTPGGPAPQEVSGQRVSAWPGSTRSEEWERLAIVCSFDEPQFKPQAGKASSAGVVIVEPDCRVWVVSPSNAFGGYRNTFPKGRVEAGFSMRASAIKEAFEETGLKVELTAFLCDAPRSTTVTRYYLARRISGNPLDMGWESQAVHLVPIARLSSFVDHPNDRPIIDALQRAQNVI